MKVKELSFSLGRTLQVKAYEPINIHYSCKVEVDIDDQNSGVMAQKVDEAYKKIESMVQTAITKKVRFYEKEIELRNKQSF